MAMTEVVREFITHFHELPGDNIKEQQKNLYKLFRDYQPKLQDGENLGLIVTNINPLNHLETIFYVDFLIFFQIFDAIYNLVLNGDEIAIKKIARENWFFEEMCKRINYQNFAESVLPTFSLSLKMKILHKLPFTENEADVVFDDINKRYGPHIAVLLLSKCSTGKINEALLHIPMRLSISTLIQIYKKSPESIEVYLDERMKHEGKVDANTYNSLFIFVAQRNPQLFSKFVNKYKIEVNLLGRRTTKRYIIAEKYNITSNVDTYMKILHKTTLIRKMGSELKVPIYEKILTQELQMDWINILNYYPKKQRFNIHKFVFDSVFSVQLEKCENCITPEILRIMPPSNEREHLAELKWKKNDDITFLKYFQTDSCFNEIVKKIDHTDASQRAKYIGILTECCVINEDMKGLLRVFKLVSGKLKNDENQVYEAFLNVLIENHKILRLLNEEHWKLISEVLVNAEIKKVWLYRKDLLTRGYLQYMLENNKSIEEPVKLITRAADWSSHFDHFLSSNKQHFRTIAELMLEQGMASSDPTEKVASEKFDCLLADYCRKYNDRQPDNIINVFNNSRLIKSAKKLLETSDPYDFLFVFPGIDYIICTHSRSEDTLAAQRVYFQKFDIYGSVRALFWFLTKHPLILEENFNEVLNHFAYKWNINTKKFWRGIKKHSSLNLESQVLAFCKEKIMAASDYKSKDRLVKPITMLSTPSSYLDFVKDFIPVSSKVDLTNEETRDMFSLQSKVARHLSLRNSPLVLLPIILEFCKGDYLNVALGSFYSLMIRLPENLIQIWIDKLNNSESISVKKHALHLMFLLSNSENAYTFVEKTTIPGLLPTLKYLSKNPSEHLWNLLRMKILKLQDDELEQLKLMFDINIPFTYKEKFLQVSWDVIEGKGKNELRTQLFEKINKVDIQHLNSAFGLKLIENVTFRSNSTNQFLARLLIHLNCDQKYTTLQRSVSEYKTAEWKDDSTKRIAMKRLKEFICTLFETYFHRHNQTDLKFAVEIFKVFDSLFSCEEFFDELIVLKCMTFKDDTVANTSRTLNDINKRITGNYSAFGVKLLSSVLNNIVFKHVFKSDHARIQICHSLFQCKSITDDFLLILMLLPKRENEFEKYATKYNEIISECNKIPDKIIQLQLNLFLRLN